MCLGNGYSTGGTSSGYGSNNIRPVQDSMRKFTIGMIYNFAIAICVRIEKCYWFERYANTLIVDGYILHVVWR